MSQAGSTGKSGGSTSHTSSLEKVELVPSRRVALPISKTLSGSQRLGIVHCLRRRGSIGVTALRAGESIVWGSNTLGTVNASSTDTSSTTTDTSIGVWIKRTHLAHVVTLRNGHGLLSIGAVAITGVASIDTLRLRVTVAVVVIVEVVKVRNVSGSRGFCCSLGDFHVELFSLSSTNCIGDDSKE